MPERTDLEQSVMRTILWFSLFETPLTAFEIWKWLMMPERAYDLSEVYSVLDKSEWLQSVLEMKHGFYALDGSGIEGLIPLRQERFLDAERKFRLLRRVATYFHVLPGVRAVGVVNTLAWWSTNPQSDIDLYIITKPGHIWSSRFWLVLPFLVLGKRPLRTIESDTVEDPFCFSFFSTREHLGMESLCVPRDHYFAFWVKSLVPIMDRDACFQNFHQENKWSHSVLPNAQPRSNHCYLTPRGTFHLPIQWSVTESVFRFLQVHRMPVHLKRMANKDTRVVVSDEVLKFHDQDRREEYRDRFESLTKHHL